MKTSNLAAQSHFTDRDILAPYILHCLWDKHVQTLSKWQLLLTWLGCLLSAWSWWLSTVPAARYWLTTSWIDCNVLWRSGSELIIWRSRKSWIKKWGRLSLADISAATSEYTDSLRASNKVLPTLKKHSLNAPIPCSNIIAIYHHHPPPPPWEEEIHKGMKEGGVKDEMVEGRKEVYCDMTLSNIHIWILRLSWWWCFKLRSSGLMQCSVVVGYQCFRDPCCLNLHFTLKMEGAQ